MKGSKNIFNAKSQRDMYKINLQYIFYDYSYIAWGQCLFKIDGHSRQ